MTNSSISSRTPLGFIGLGYLGSRIARRLSAAGFAMLVYDRDHSRTAELGAPGVDVARNISDLVHNVDVVLSCLPDDSAVNDVYFEPKNVLDTTGTYSRIIELSTIKPATAKRLNDAAAAIGVSVLDVAVSGSTPAAEAGSLTLFGGGERTDFEAAQPIFTAIAKQWFYMGPAGSGVAMKLVVNTLLGIGMEAIAEAVALGAGLGLQRDLLLETLARTAVVAPAHAGKLASAMHDDYSPQFPVRLMRKDFGLILEEAERAGVSMPAAKASAAVNAAEDATGGEEDFSAVIRRLEKTTRPEHPQPQLLRSAG